MRRLTMIALLPVLLIGLPLNADDKKEAEKPKRAELIVMPASGDAKTRVTDWQFTQGTRYFSLTTDVPAKPRERSAGTECLEFRELNSTTYQNGILTLVPIESIRRIDYDKDKKTVAVIAVKAGDMDEKLNGFTKFIGINRVTIEGESQLEGLGAAAVKFHGGADKGPRSFSFANPKPVAEVKGPTSEIVATDKEKSKHAVHELQPLYVVDGNYRAMPYLMFKKTVKIEMDKIAALKFVPSEDKKSATSDCEVTLGDGAKHTLILLTKIELDKGKSATLEGLAGRVPAGYKLFPLHTIQELHSAEKKE